MNVIEQSLKKFYENRDESHDWSHIQKVKDNLCNIIETMTFNEIEQEILILSCLGHDIWDSKYCKEEEIITNKKHNFEEILVKHGYDKDIIETIILIIDNISFSKEYKLRKMNKTFCLNQYILNLRNIVSDADKLEALGIEGMKRMIAYNNYKNNENIIIDMKNHYYEKLVILLEENYLHTDFAKALAKIKLKEMENIITNDLLLENFIRMNTPYNI